jgi:hypothetical protein
LKLKIRMHAAALLPSLSGVHLSVAAVAVAQETEKFRKIHLARLKFVNAVTTNITVFWGVTPCSLTPNTNVSQALSDSTALVPTRCHMQQVTTSDTKTDKV